MTDRTAIEAAFRRQAEICRGYGSALYGHLLDACAADIAGGGAVADAVAGFAAPPQRQALPLRLMGAVHDLVLSGRAPALAAAYPSVGGAGHGRRTFAAFAAVVSAELEFVRERLTRAPQTNEVGRSSALLGGFLAIAARGPRPLRLLEIGASAGLNLLWDRYRYEFGAFRWGDPRAGVRLRASWDGPPPPLAAPVRVRSRRGCDLHPVDVADPAQRRGLESYVWADQTGRLRTLRAALDVALAEPPQVDERSVLPWLEQQLGEPAAGATTVVYHSVVWPYLSDAEQRQFAALMQAHGEQRPDGAPLAWLRLEENGPDKDLCLRVWPGGEDRLLAHSNPHGTRVEWLAE